MFGFLFFTAILTAITAFELHSTEMPVCKFMDPYIPYSVIAPPMFGFPGRLIQVLSPPYQLMELMEAEYLCIDVKHDVIFSKTYGKIHHFTVAKWSTPMNKSIVVGRILINGMTREIMAEGLIALFSAAERATGEKVDFFQVRILFHYY